MTIDYSLNSVYGLENKTKIILQRIGQMGMPIDLQIILKSGESINYNIPMTKMRGSKPLKNSRLLRSWSWAKPYYSFDLEINKNDISKILIDPKGKMADINRDNNYIIF